MKMAIYKPRTEALEEANFAYTSISHFQPPESCEDKLLSFKPLWLWDFVTAVRADCTPLFVVPAHRILPSRRGA